MLVFSISGFLTFLQTSLFVIGYISKNSLFPEPLNAEEEKMYLQMLENGDKEARAILIERNLRLVVYIAKKKNYYFQVILCFEELGEEQTCQLEALKK